MRNLRKQKTIGWISGGGVLALFAAIIVANLQGTDEQPIDVARLRADLTPATATSSPVPAGNTPFDSSPQPDTSPTVSSRARAAVHNTNPPDVLYAALYSRNPEERFNALDSIWESAETFYKLENIVRRIDELGADADPRIAELAPLVLAHMMELHGMQDTLMNSNQDTYVATSPAPQDDTLAHAEPHRTNSNSDAHESAGTEREDFARLNERTPGHDAASMRMQAIEAALTQRDERSLAMLSQATQDASAENRLAAVEGLRQMLEEGFGDASQISGMLHQSSRDPDPKVAEAAQQAIREQADTAN